MQTMQIATSRASASALTAAPHSTPGREAKKERTFRRMERAAVSLALEYGSENITVDEICAASDVSARTFFNYFGSKEAALIGRGKPLPSADAVAQFVADTGSVLGDFVKMIVRAALENDPDLDLIRARRQLFEREPALAIQSFVRSADTRDEYVDIVSARIDRERPHLDPSEIAAEAHVATAVLMGLFHVIGSSWIESGGTADLHDLVDEALARLDRLV